LFIIFSVSSNIAVEFIKKFNVNIGNNLNNVPAHGFGESLFLNPTKLQN
jgi:hypothetical protein